MNLHQVKGIRYLSDSVYVLSFEKKGIEFIPGQHINVGFPGEENRPYSIYSGIDNVHLEILVKEVINGNISRKLKKMKPGEMISVDQAEGDFTIENELKEQVPFWFIGTGTGISPFHSFVLSYSDIHYRIIHGIRNKNESYEHKTYKNGAYFNCTSRDEKGDFNGRVNEYLESSILDKIAFYYLCGSYEMIDRVYDVLISKGISKAQIKSEGYF